MDRLHKYLKPPINHFYYFLKIDILSTSLLLFCSPMRFYTCRDSCNPHHKRHKTIPKPKIIPWCRLFVPAPIALICSYAFAFSRLSHKANHTVCTLLRLASFTQRNAFEIQPHGCAQQQPVPFHCRVVFHCIDVLQVCFFIILIHQSLKNI